MLGLEVVLVRGQGGCQGFMKERSKKLQESREKGKRKDKPVHLERMDSVNRN